MNQEIFSESTKLLEYFKDEVVASEDVYVLPTDTSQLLFDMFRKYEDTKEIVKNAVKTAFELNGKDLIFFRESKIFIKRLKSQSNEAVSELKAVPATSVSSDVNISDNCIIVSAKEVLADTEHDGKELASEIKEYIRTKLRQEINLKQKDIIVFMGDKIVIRRFAESSDDKEGKTEQRYNGLPKEELEVIRRKNFADEENERVVIKSVMDSLLSGELNFGVISFAYFEKNYVKTIQKGITSFLNDNLYEEEPVLLGLTNMLLRVHWNYAHKLMAEKLVELLEKKDTNAEKFLKTYSGDITLGSDNIRYKFPEIIDEKGKRWNAVSIYSLIMQYKKAQETIELKKKAFQIYMQKNETLEQEIEKIEQEGPDLQALSSALETELLSFFDEEKVLNEEIKTLRANMKDSVSESEKASLQNDISAKMMAIKKIAIRQDNANGKKKKIDSQLKLAGSKIEKLKHEIAQNIKKQKEEESKFNGFVMSLRDVNAKFGIVVNAIAATLMKKKTPV